MKKISLFILLTLFIGGSYFFSVTKSHKDKKIVEHSPNHMDKKQSNKLILILGDSLTEGYGIDKENAYPLILEKMINNENKKKFKVINAGVSGMTTKGGIDALKWHLKKSSPNILVLALGANDGLRGVPLRETQQNLEQLIALSLEKTSKVLLVGMMAPPNYGIEYSQGLRNLYKKLSEKYKISCVPFLLENIGGENDLNQEDGIHPNEKGHELMAKNVYKYLRPLL